MVKSLTDENLSKYREHTQKDRYGALTDNGFKRTHSA